MEEKKLNFPIWQMIIACIKEHGEPIMTWGEKWTDMTLTEHERKTKWNKFAISYNEICKILKMPPSQLSRGISYLEDFRIIRRHKMDGKLEGFLILDNKFCTLIWEAIREREQI